MVLIVAGSLRKELSHAWIDQRDPWRSIDDGGIGLIAAPEEHAVVSGVAVGEVATGGTLFANALSMAAGRAALEEVLTQDAFERARELGGRVAASAYPDLHGEPWDLGIGLVVGSHGFRRAYRRGRGSVRRRFLGVSCGRDVEEFSHIGLGSPTQTCRSRIIDVAADSVDSKDR